MVHMCVIDAPVPDLPERAHVLILSDDALLCELVAELLTQERFRVSEAGDLATARACVLSDAPAVLLVDAMVDADLALPVLSDPSAVLGDAGFAIVLISGAGTPAGVREHPIVDRVLTQPLTADVLVNVLRHCASWHTRRQMQSGTRLRPDAITLAPPATGTRSE